MMFERPEVELPGNLSIVQTTRLGGFSSGVYSGMNVAEHVGDDAANVRLNRTELASTLALPSEPCWLKQIHSNRIGMSGEVDGSYSGERGSVLAIQTADCLPIVMWSEDGGEIAAVHAGWKGLRDGIIANAAAHFSVALAGAWIGAHIKQCHYEVGNEFRHYFPDDDAAFQPGDYGDKWMLSLTHIARCQLDAAGVRTITESADCTYCARERYFSYRRDGECGRMATLIWRT